MAETYCEITHERLSTNLACIKFIGEVDVYNAPKFREYLDHLIDDGIYYLALNLKEAIYFDSTGLGALIRALKRCREKGGDIVLISIPLRIYEPLRITHLIDIFTCAKSELEATDFLVKNGAEQSQIT